MESIIQVIWKEWLARVRPARRIADLLYGCHAPETENERIASGAWPLRFVKHPSETSDYTMGRTKNLTRIHEGNHIDLVLKFAYTYDHQITERCSVKSRYLEEKHKAEEIYQEKFKVLNRELLDSLDRFVETCLDLKNENLFAKYGSDGIYGATLCLNMRTSDHEPTYSLIENSLKKFKRLVVVRLKVNSIRKRSLLNILEPSRLVKRVLIMVEQAETLSPAITDMLIGNLKNRVEDEASPTSVVMVVFCLSVRIQELPFDHFNGLAGFWPIESDNSHHNLEILEELVRNRGITMKLGPDALNFIHDYYQNVDPSISNVVYLLNHALFEHYHRLEDVYKRMNESARSAWRKLESKYEKHQYVCDQLLNLALLLRDQGLFPEDVSDVYELLLDYENLSHSKELVDALMNLGKLKHETSLRRIDRVLMRAERVKATKNGMTTVVSILASYRDKILNNKDCTEIVSSMINELIEYVRDLENPLAKDIYHIYFHNRAELSKSSMTAARYEDTFMENFCGKDRTYFSILVRYLLNAQGSLGVFDLMTEVEDEYKELMRNERSPTLRKGPRIKVTPKKAAGRSSRAAATTASAAITVSAGTNVESQAAPKGLDGEEEDGLIKALFADIIDCLELQLMIKLDPRTKQRCLKRLVWPAIRPDAGGAEK